MNPRPHRRVMAVALCAALMSPATWACEFFAPTLRILHPWTRATPEGATTAIVSMKFDEVNTADRLIGVETPLASGAEMGGARSGSQVDFPIAQGAESALSETATHVRLVGLKHRLEVGRSYPLTLIFEKGGVVKADLEVDYAD